jgi:hypothetical protein
MGTGEGPPPARRENGVSRRRWLDGEEEDDDEYVLEEEEEEDYAEELSASSAGEEGEGSDAEYQEDEDEEEEEIETPRLKRPVKASDRRRKGKLDPAAARSRRRKYEEDEDYEEEIEEEEEVEEYHDELDEEEEAHQRPKSVAKCGGRNRNVKPSTAAKRSHQRRHLDDEDMDFDPELDEEEELDEDIDFDPEVDDDDEDEYQDEEEEELAATRARKVTVKNPAKRKSASKRRTLKKKKKKTKGSKVSGRKSASAKAKKSAPIRRRRKRSVVDEYEDDEDEDDDDFIVEDEHPRKKARTRNGREAQVDPEVSPVEEETWPNLESDTSDFEFATSDEEPNIVETQVVEQISVRKGRKKRISGSESSSDSEFVVSDKELEDLKETELPKPVPMLPASIRRICITRHGEGKGKEKQEPEEAGNPICGICLSEEQRATVQGVLNCCSHYFCFACIMEWSRVESRCPLCKQRFTTITKSSKVDLGLGVRKSVIKVEERDQVRFCFAVVFT